jgi:hypothetical protein
MFQRWSRRHGFRPEDGIDNLADVPFLPVGIFKRLLLQSVPDEQIVRVLTSSATSSQTPSRIPLDSVTRNRQIRALLAILVHRLGGARRPFVILDVPPTLESLASQEISARAAGMRGYFMAASSTEYVLRNEGDQLTLDVPKFADVLASLTSRGEAFCLLGYTYLLYNQVVATLRRQGVQFHLPDNAAVLHFGGWKKLADRAVNKSTFLSHTTDVFGIRENAVCDIYGFTEQLGVIYPDAVDGVKRVPTYSEVFVRDPRTLELVEDGEIGLLEFVCPLPHSYPGIAVLLDDMGRVTTRAAGPNGQTGAGFEVVGRASRAEPRGCGDTLPASVYQKAK